MNDTFNPVFWYKNHYFQTIFSSLKIRAWGKNSMIDCAKEVIIDGGNGVRLLGYFSSHFRDEKKKGLVLLIHGWEGSSNSTYILNTGKYLFSQGYDIFRLNLRDHGDSHHFNEGIFLSTLLDETFKAVQNISQLTEDDPFCIIGFSLGGNFAIRIALWKPLLLIRNLKHIICISPVLDPYKATLAIDNDFIFKNYFLYKWRRSLIIKQKLFPKKYDFENIRRKKTILELTEFLLHNYTNYKSATEYFNCYTIKDDAFLDLKIPLTIITSEDDKIILVDDFFNLKKNIHLNLLIQQYGGHCGFLDSFPFGCWYERKIINLIDNI